MNGGRLILSIFFFLNLFSVTKTTFYIQTKKTIRFSKAVGMCY